MDGNTTPTCLSTRNPQHPTASAARDSHTATASSLPRHRHHHRHDPSPLSSSALRPPPPAMALLQASALSVPPAFASSDATAAAPAPSPLRTPFLATRTFGLLSLTRHLGVHNGSRVSAWFKFGSSGADSKEAGIYGSQKRDDFDKDDVEQVCCRIFSHNLISRVSPRLTPSPCWGFRVFLGLG